MKMINNNFEKMLKTLKNMNFSIFTFAIQLLTDITATAVIFTVAGILTCTDAQKIPESIRIYLPYFIICFCLISPAVHNFLVKNISSEISYWKVSGLIRERRINLLENILRFPIKKALETFCIFALNSFFTASAISNTYSLNRYTSVSVFFISLILSFFYSVLCIHIHEKHCSEIAYKLIEQGATKEGQKYHGASIQFSFAIYIIAALILSGILSILIINLRDDYSKNLINLGFISILSIIIIGTTSYIYYNKITAYTNKMKQALESLRNQNFDNINLFTSDLSNEISYTLFLVNKAILQFNKLNYENSGIKEEIFTLSKNLYQISSETQKNTLAQNINFAQIFSSVQNCSFLSQSMETNISETINVAEKTRSEINQNLQNINENISQMSVVSHALKRASNGIEILAKKIINIKTQLNIINNIAGQTKIVAFNAQLESQTLHGDKANFTEIAAGISSLSDEIIELTQNIKNETLIMEKETKQIVQNGDSFITKIEDVNKLFSEIQNRFLHIQKYTEKTVSLAKMIDSSIKIQRTNFDITVSNIGKLNIGTGNFNESISGISKTIDKILTDSSETR